MVYLEIAYELIAVVLIAYGMSIWRRQAAIDTETRTL